jgi:hypothetical protein
MVNLAGEKTNMNEARNAFLLHAAERYIWWETTNITLAYPQRIIAQVMNIGVWDDMCKLVELFSPRELKSVLKDAEIGQFNERSWNFWHLRLTDETPPMPKRVLS